MNNNYSEGAFIKAWCPRCNLKSEHTIIAIVNNMPKKIKCNTCEEYHNVIVMQSGKSRTKSKSTSRKSSSKEKMYEKYLSRLTGGNSAKCTKYTIQGNFEKDQIIDHLKFGIGIVLSVIQINKIEILFKDGPRLLTQNQ